MSRKPINEISALQTLGALWVAIRQLQSFTPAQLRKETRCSVSQTREYIAGLTAAGILERSEEDRQATYLLVKDIGIEAPRVRRDGTLVTIGLGREQMWRTMRLLKEFSHLDLSIQASTEEAPVSIGTAQEYCRILCHAGYLTLVRVGKGTGSGGQLALYRFVPSRYSGPLPPMIQRSKSLFDPNLKKIVYSEEAGHDCQ